MSDRVAFLGLGLMGSGMARNLLAAGFQLSVFNRNRAKAAPFAELGARIGSFPRDAAEGAGIVISMLTNDAAARAVWLGPEGAISGAAPGTLLIESSTVSLVCMRELAAAAEAAGCEFLDAPVTGSRVEAERGELRFLVGGSESTLLRALPVLEAMSREVVHIGPAGSGALMKLVNNFLVGVHAAAFAEALAFIEKGGLDREKALGILTAGAPGSPIVRALAARILSDDRTVYSPLHLTPKDLGYAEAAAGELGIKLTIAEAARSFFQLAIDAGLGDEDVATAVEPLRRGRS